LSTEEDLRAARAGGPAAELAQLESDLQKSAAELARLRREREALSRLVEKKAASRQELEAARVALEQAEAQARLLEARKADLQRRARLDLDRLQLALQRIESQMRAAEEQVRGAQLAAPAAGTAYLIRVRPRDFVRTGDLLAEIADLDRIRVRILVDEPELGALEAGQPVEVTWDALPGEVWKGRTESVPRAVVQRGARSVGEVLCSVDAPGGKLLPNTTVNVLIQTRTRDNVLTIPRAAVRVDGNVRSVFLIDGDRLRRREVRVGLASATEFEILEGLREGDRVALPGDFEQRDAMQVRVAASR
jgi:RND family efflux transporter MFP subunit